MSKLRVASKLHVASKRGIIMALAATVLGELTITTEVAEPVSSAKVLSDSSKAMAEAKAKRTRKAAKRLRTVSDADVLGFDSKESSKDSGVVTIKQSVVALGQVGLIHADSVLPIGSRQVTANIAAMHGKPARVTYAS